MNITYDPGTPELLDIARKMIRVACQRPDELAAVSRHAATMPEFAHGLIGTLVIVILHESTGGDWTLPAAPSQSHLQVVDGNDEPMDVDRLSQVDRNIARMLSHMAAGDMATVSAMIAPALDNPTDGGRLIRRLCQYAHACMHSDTRLVTVHYKDEP